MARLSKPVVVFLVCSILGIMAALLLPAFTVPHRPPPFHPKWGFIDKTGRYVIPATFDSARGFSEGLAAAKVNGKWGYINKAGEFAIKPRFAEAWAFRNGFASVNAGGEYVGMGGIEGGKWLYIDRTGKTVDDHLAQSARSSSEDRQRVEVHRKWGYRDRIGTMIIQPRFDWAGDFSEGLAPVMVGYDPGGHDERKYGFIDKSGEYVIEPQFDNVRPFSGGLATYEKNDLWGIIDPKGNIVTPPRYLQSWGFSEGLAAAMIAPTIPYDEYHYGDSSIQWGFVDGSGNFVIEPRFGWAQNFSEGLAAVMTRKPDDADSLFRAVYGGRADELKSLLAAGADVNGPNYGMSLLHLAAAVGQKEIVDVLVENGADINARHAYYADYAPLHYAVENGHLDIAETLLSRGADANAECNGLLGTPLQMAVRSGETEMVKLLVSHGAQTSIYGYSDSPLHTAIVKGQSELFHRLLTDKTDVNAGSRGLRWLHLAAKYGRLDMARALLERKADVNAKAHVELTPLHVAAARGHADIVKLFLDAGARFDVKSGRGGWTPLEFAVRYRVRYRHPQAAKLLRNAGAKESANKGGSPDARELLKLSPLEE